MSFSPDPFSSNSALGSGTGFPRRVAVLGASGNIGSQALEVIANSSGRLEIALLSVHSNTKALADMISRISLRRLTYKIGCTEEPPLLPTCVIITDENADRTPLEDIPSEIEVLFGQEALCERIAGEDIDIVLSAIVGSAGLRSTWAALNAGKTVALANKESLVMAGELMRELAEKTGGKIVPVDSEHSAIMQCLRSVCGEETNEILDSKISRLILTASGGPFRTRSLAELTNVRLQEALAHPTWNMGKKITIDSATLMNKALELIEARWFFDIDPQKLSVVIHPQSIVHSMVEFIDGSVIAQLGTPDMQLPIQVALCYPRRFDGPARRIDWTNEQKLEFYNPDPERFEAISLGLEVARTGGSGGVVLNAANEAAVSAFLGGELPFSKITTVCRSVLEHHNFEQHPTLQRLFELDEWARKETKIWTRG